MSYPTSRFLCPHCLQFSEALYACPGCWEEIGTLRLRLNVGALQACPCCFDALYPEEGSDRLAFCEHCRQLSDARLHHDRDVRLVGAVGARGLMQIRRHLGLDENGEGPVWVAEGSRVTWLFDLSTVAAGVNLTGAAHALRHLEALWLESTQLEPLELGRIVDRFVRQARLSRGRRQTLPVLIREASLPVATLNVLRSRLSNLRYGVEPSEVLSAESNWNAEGLTLDHAPPRVIATLDEQAHCTLAALLPPGRLRCLHPGIECAEMNGRLTFLVNATLLARSRKARVAPVLEEADGVWIERVIAPDSLAPLTARLRFLLGRNMATRGRIVCW